MKHTRRKAVKPQQPERIGNGTTTGTYKPNWQSARPNADDFLAIPSLHNGTRYYRDGRKERA